ncbi:U3 small nucleolar RNA-associated protein 15 [Sphaceloma murrayae]|uniref:U3 small nucleolar RNA-associated protein 15 n=1 Tax=Sphaceloma murrayae TaxID=2082308 RepID=A0A2K1QT86_9PEZI|nr:U3 small nucleolar RNA-associated protein 15 [Sphaceloma murrayae]
MAAEVQPLPIIAAAPGPSSTTPDQSYWRSFKSQLLLPSPQSAPITHISTPISHSSTSSSTATVPTDNFALTSGSRITLLSTRTRRVTKTITRISFSDTAHSGEIRRDGRIVIASGESGAIQAFDASSRAVLRTWREHKQAVWSVRWNPSTLTESMSCSDDGSVRIWDLPTEDSVGQFYGHTDYVRSGAYLEGAGGKVLVSGSYDRTVRVWDSRSGKGVMCFAFADPVETVLGLGDGGTVVVGAGEKIGVLDLTAGRPREVLQNHQKAVTSLAVASQGRRVVSGGLDGHVKVFDTSDWKVVAGFKYPSPVLSVGVIPSGADKEDRHLCVGMQSGLLSIRTRLSGQQKVAAREREKEMKALVEGKIEDFDKKKKKLRQGDKKRLRGKDFTGEGADIIIEGNARGKIKNQSKWETALRKGQWQESVDILLKQEHINKDAMLTLLTALHHRSALRVALTGKDEAMLGPFFKWITKNINDPRYVRLLSDVSLHLLDIYAPQLGGDDRSEESLDSMVAQLHRRVRHGVEIAKMAGSTGSMLDFVGVEAG